MPIQRILVVGSHLGYVQHMDEGLIHGFAEIGCEVASFDYRASSLTPNWLRRLIPHGIRHRLSPRRLSSVERMDRLVSNNHFTARLNDVRPQLVVSLQAERLSAESIKSAAELGAVTMNWIGDEPWRNVPPAIVSAYDIWMVIDPTWGPWLVERGARRVEHLAVACDPLVHRPVTLNEAARERWRSRLCFVGGYGENRERILASVADMGLSIWGPGWEQAKQPELRQCVRQSRMLTREEWQQAFAAAEVVLNIHAQGQECLNMKVFEALSAEVCLLSDYKRDLDRVLNGVVASFRDEAELRHQCKLLLASVERRRSLAQLGRKEVLQRHTFAHRARQMREWAESAREMKAS